MHACGIFKIYEISAGSHDSKRSKMKNSKNVVPGMPDARRADIWSHPPILNKACLMRPISSIVGCVWHLKEF